MPTEPMDSELEKLCTFSGIYGMANFSAHDAAEKYLRHNANIQNNANLTKLRNAINFLPNTGGITPEISFLFQLNLSELSTFKTRLIERIDRITSKVADLNLLAVEAKHAEKNFLRGPKKLAGTEALARARKI